MPSAASADSIAMRLMWPGALAGVLIAVSTVSAQREAPLDSEILRRLEQMDGALRGIQTRLEELSAAIRGGPPSSPVETVEGRNIQISLRGAAAKGSPAARIAIVEYSDFECPFCGQHACCVWRARRNDCITRNSCPIAAARSDCRRASKC